MTQPNSEEQTVAANIEKLAKLLNEELEKAFTLGLKTQVSSDSYRALFVSPRSDHVTVRVWREITLVAPKTNIKADQVIGNALPK